VPNIGRVAHRQSGGLQNRVSALLLQRQKARNPFISEGFSDRAASANEQNDTETYGMRWHEKGHSGGTVCSRYSLCLPLLLRCQKLEVNFGRSDAGVPHPLLQIVKRPA